MGLEIPVELIVNGWMIVPSPEEFQKLRSDDSSINIGLMTDLVGAAFAWDLCERVLGSRDRDVVLGLKWPVRCHQASSISALFEVIQAYQKLADDFNLQCLFRGQYRDYFDSAQILTVTPASWRSDFGDEYYLLRSETLDRMLAPWASVVEELDLSSYSMGRVHWIRRSAVRILSNPFLLALVMHYGFPTPALDVTPDPWVALWFALHRAIKDEAGHFVYRPASEVNSQDRPSLYIYLQQDRPENPVIDISALDGLREHALRPFRQSATALPFVTFDSWQSGGMDSGTGQSSGPSIRWPSAVVKVNFGAQELHSARPDLVADYLFPKDEDLYRKLVEANVPSVAIYR